MPHDSTCMPRVKNPTKRFCEVISRVQNPGTMYELGLESFFPVLYRKIQYINVPRVLCGLFCIDHLDGGHVIFEEAGRALHRETKVSKSTTALGTPHFGGPTNWHIQIRTPFKQKGDYVRTIASVPACVNSNNNRDLDMTIKLCFHN